MNKRILEILSNVMREIRDSSLENLDLQLLFDILSEQGFSDEEISTAMSWLMDHGESVDRLLQSPLSNIPKPIWRQLNETEQTIISPTAFSYLFHLRELEILSDSDMERIIERAQYLQIQEMNVEEMQDLIAAVMLEFEDSASTGYFQFTSSNRFQH